MQSSLFAKVQNLFHKEVVYRYEGRVFSSNQRDLCSLHCLSMPVPTAAGKSVSKLSAVCVCVYNATIIYGTFFTALLPCVKESFFVDLLPSDGES